MKQIQRIRWLNSKGRLWDKGNRASGSRWGEGLVSAPSQPCREKGKTQIYLCSWFLNTWILNHQDHHPREPCFIFLPETQRSCHCVPLGQAPDNLQRLSALFCALLCQVLEEAVASQGSHTQASAPLGLSLFSAPSPAHYCPQDQTVAACGRGLWKRLLDLTVERRGNGHV